MTTPASSAPVAIDLGSETGFAFQAESSAAFCFVPAQHVDFAPDGAATIGLVAYVASGWSVRNERCAEIESTGRHLFPDAARPVTEAQLSGLEETLARWRRMAAR